MTDTSGRKTGVLFEPLPYKHLTQTLLARAGWKAPANDRFEVRTSSFRMIGIERHARRDRWRTTLEDLRPEFSDKKQANGQQHQQRDEAPEDIGSDTQKSHRPTALMGVNGT